MRWVLPINTQTRTRRVFAWWPRELATHKIWLEFYEVEEMYIQGRWIVQRRNIIERT